MCGVPIGSTDDLQVKKKQLKTTLFDMRRTNCSDSMEYWWDYVPYDCLMELHWWTSGIVSRHDVNVNTEIGDAIVTIIRRQGFLSNCFFIDPAYPWANKPHTVL